MRRSVIALLILVILLTPVATAPRQATAATFRNHVARVPEAPTSQQSARVWMQSDTALGETAALEYNIVGTNTYVKVYGSFDTGGPSPANWRADIPAHPNGTQIRYQLFTRNQSGGEYGHTGFNWNYTVFDGDIAWNGLRHNTFDSYYRSPFGAVPAGTSVTLRFRAERFNADQVFIRVYHYNPATDSTAPPVEYPMSFLEDRSEGGTTYAIWTRTLTTPSSPAILYYKFRVVQRLDEDWYSDAYADDHDNLNQGGEGAASDGEPNPSFQLTVYDPNFQTPDWLKNANVYQIFPDRFRNGDKTNDYCAQNGSSGCPTFYGNQPVVPHAVWNEEVYDPRAQGMYFGTYGTQFYGGDLKGVQDRLDYLQGLGIDTLYFTPIFKGSSNHRYDTDNFLEVDPALGGNAAFESLVREAERRGMHIILDGVFNHTSSDSVYFDRYNRYASAGACESLASPFRNWFVFHNNNVPCGSGDYQGWFGYDSLSVLRDESAAVRGFFYRDPTNVTRHWYDRGAAGWRFDVADEITHNWWRDYRGYAKSYKASGPLVGEVWHDASKFLLGDQLDSVMNYRFRKNILGFARGVGWRDNDNNGSNEIVGLNPSQFDRSLKSLLEDYPPQAQAAMFNLVDSHDTNRALYLLTLLGDTGLSQAKERLKLTALFQFTWIGAPTVYYGDEAAINAPSRGTGANGPEDDPYNRAPYPWADEAGDPNVYGPRDPDMITFYSKLAHMRKQHPALRGTGFASLLAGDTTTSASDNSTYAFARSGGGETAIVVLNNGAAGNTAVVPVGAYFPDGTTLKDALSAASYTVSGGSVSVTLGGRSGQVLFPAAAAVVDVAAPVANAAATPAPNAAGWNNTSPVTVNLSGADNPGGSGVKELRYWIDNGGVTVVPGAGASVQVSADNTTVSVRAIDNAGNQSAVASVTIRIDTQAPDTAITERPAGLGNSSSAGFSFSATEAGAAFECRLDTGTFTVCASPQTYNNLAGGSHTFEVRAVDVAGNADASPATYTWTVDTAAPQTDITGRPAALTNQRGASFTFTATEIGSTFECSLDGAEFAACASPQAYAGLADGNHTFAVRATDPAGNSDPTPDSYGWSVDTAAPNTALDGHPAALTNGDDASFSFGASEAGATFQCSLDGAEFATCASPQSYNGLAEGQHSFQVRAIDAAGNVDASPAVFSWTIDRTPGDTVIDAAPPALTNSAGAAFSFSAEATSRFECRLDGAAFAACASPQTYGNLANGSHTFEVRSIDPAGNVDQTPAGHTWAIDTVAPDTAIVDAPAASSNSSSAAFSFTATEAGGFRCSLDGAAFTACAGPQNYNDLADGSHTFRVQAVDAAGNADASPATHTWTVDTTAPDTLIDAGPANPTNAGSAGFTFHATEPGAGFQCSLDGGDFAPCTSPVSYNGLAEGRHTFEVRATDLAGNADATPGTFAWTVDATPPQTTIESGPAALSNSKSATFRFGGDESGASFECRLDGGAFAACESPRAFANLGEGTHTFEVRARDLAGNVDPSPDSLTWTVDTVAPDTVIDSRPPAVSNSSEAGFTFHSTEPGSTFQCSIEGGTFRTCPPSFTDLAEGQHTFAVRAIDPAGNVDPTPASYSWTVDLTAADTAIVAQPAPVTRSADATFRFTAESGSTFECKLDAGAFAPCASPKTYSGLSGGNHTFAVRAIDPAGNVDPTPATFAWTIDTAAPETTIEQRPAALTRSTSASFTFTAGEVGSSFECSLDAAAFAPCSSPATFNNLADGSHLFEVRAIDAAGNVDSTPAGHGWTVDTAAPDTTINATPPAIGNSGSAEFTFGASEQGSTFECKLDAGAFAPCASPQTYGGLANGAYTFQVRATDAAGNVDPSPAAYTWQITPSYGFTGFYAPVANPPAVNSVRAGSSVPVKFSLAGNRGLDIFAAGYPLSQQVDCGSKAPLGAAAPIDLAGGSSLGYDADTGQYAMVWKTEQSWAGTCRQLVLRLKDGSEHTALFQFR